MRIHLPSLAAAGLAVSFGCAVPGTEAESAVAAPPDQISWRALLSKAPVWALIYNHFCNNWGFYVILTWRPTYFTEDLGVELSQVGAYTVLPWLVMFVVGNSAGWLSGDPP